MNKKYNTALIFDLDGTLWNACETIAQAWEQVRKDFAIAGKIIDKEAVEGICGLITEEVFKVIFPNNYQNKSLIEACLKAQSDLLATQGGKPYEGVIDMLHNLAKDYNLFIVSNCQKGYIELFINQFQLADQIKDFACYGDALQPKAYNIKTILKRNAIEKAVYIGDTMGDCQASRANELPFIYCAYGFGHVAPSQYNFVLHQFQDIKIFLDEQA